MTASVACFYISLFAAMWTLLVVIAGIQIGWRTRGGLPPMSSLPNPFAKKHEPPPAPPAFKPKAQEKV